MHLLPPVFSSVFRLVSYVFLQIIPTRIAVPALPLLYIAYLSSLCLCPITNHGPTTDSKKPTSAVQPQEPSRLATILLGLKSRERFPNVANVLINTLLLLASLDFALNPLVFSEVGVTFSRIGAVYPDAAKITLRYPIAGSTSQDIQILYRETSLSSDTPWKFGPLVTVSEENDWVNTTTVTNLWPDTRYEYIFSVGPDRLELPYPRESNTFQTFPDPRLNVGSHFKFIVSSCITPNFPYKGPLERHTIHGFDLLAQSFATTSPPQAPELPAINETNNTSEAISDTRASELEPGLVSRILPKFMLFLGDFIYADVPIYFGDNKDAYSRFYRRNYASPSFRKIYEHIPMLHVYDDHEIINNWGGSGRDPAPYPYASHAYKAYNGLANYDSPEIGDHYFNFTYGSDVAFFVMDTRRHRSDIDVVGVEERTMLGERQLEAFSSWLAKVNNTATFKFVVSSVPFTSLWGHDARKDSWGGYEVEKAHILEQLHTVANVIILSGDRHEFAAIEFTGPNDDSYTVQEFSTSPLNMFYIPLVRTLKTVSEAMVWRTRNETRLTSDGGPEVVLVSESVPKERVVKYIPNGNVKWSSIDIDTTNKTRPILRLETWIDGRVAYETETIGTPIKDVSSKALISVPSSIKHLLEKIGLQSKQWF